jgi:hypothetical protein
MGARCKEARCTTGLFNCFYDNLLSYVSYLILFLFYQLILLFSFGQGSTLFVLFFEALPQCRLTKKFFVIAGLTRNPKMSVKYKYCKILDNSY